jgi:hypothetical protein
MGMVLLLSNASTEPSRPPAEGCCALCPDDRQRPGPELARSFSSAVLRSQDACAYLRDWGVDKVAGVIVVDQE